MDLKGNFSTAHAGDAKRPESATLDKNRRSSTGAEGAPAGNMGANQDDQDANGGSDLTESADVNEGQEDQIHQAVENQSRVTPDDYPEKNDMAHADKG